MHPRLAALLDAGQAVWLDYIRRDLLDTGELRRLVDDGVRGLTSNPTIFHKAIAETSLYDATITAHAEDEPEGIYERLAVADIREAADVFSPVYEATDGRDGFVSLEVSPHLAYDVEGTVADARRLWATVDRPNLMIKVPATPEGVTAIETLVAEGINVNATLMFGLHHYEAVATAYLRGVARARRPTASVASFFVSRIDTKVDAALEGLADPGAGTLRGTIAVANAKLAYRRFRELFADAEAVQRPLWASTSTKNPAYPDVLYVEELVGEHTVNTMPPATLEAFLDHGRVVPGAVERDVEEAAERIDRLGELGIDFHEITETLQREGVEAFARSYDELLAAIDAKRRALVAGS
ncbi:MAG TPA: transaldolase [Actinobacteria bacterium]|nr:transaldolase [Actinomycetota bacterium]